MGGGTTLRTIGLAAAAWLAVLGVVALPATAQAQTLVSNLGQSVTDSLFLTEDFLRAQAFSIPSGDEQYTLASIEISGGNVASIPPFYAPASNIDLLTVGVWSADSSGHPANSLYTLTNPTSINPSATATFTAPEGATLDSVSALVSAGEAANAYLFTLTPGGDGPITFNLVSGQSCASGGSCTADGTTLSEVPAPRVIPRAPINLIASPDALEIREGTTAAYSVVFNENPAELYSVECGDDVWVQVRHADGTDVTLDRYSHQVSSGDGNCNGGNWSQPKSFQVSADRDDDAQKDPLVTLTHEVWNARAETVLTGPNVTVAIIEDEGGGHRGAEDRRDRDHVESGVGCDLCSGGYDRGDGDFQRNDSGEGDTTVDAGRRRSGPNCELSKRHRRRGDVRIPGGRRGERSQRGEPGGGQPVSERGDD